MTLSKSILRLADSPLNRAANDNDALVYTHEQDQAFEMFKKHRLSLIIGAPGVGKSTCIRRMVRHVLDSQETLALCAPSGKAAKRMSDVVSYPAATIHRMLKAVPTNAGFRFEHHAGNRLPHDVVIMDETSMVDVSLMAGVMQALKPEARLLLVGDDNQLPPVGAGAVLRDLIYSGVAPATKLTIIHRNSGDIVRACHQIKNGQCYIPSPALDIEAGRNLRHVEESRPEAVVRIICEIATRRLADRGLDPLWDVQVLSPKNQQTEMSVDALNRALQAILNPSGAPIEGTAFRVGDKVLNTRNEVIGSEMIVNGDIGQILDQKKQSLFVRFLFPDRTVEIKRTTHNLILAYCCTTHRYQGSEVPVIIFPVHPNFGAFVNRPWIYTAISRAQKMCFTVGRFTAVQAAIGRSEAAARVTRLALNLQRKHRALARM